MRKMVKLRKRNETEKEMNNIIKKTEEKGANDINHEEEIEDHELEMVKQATSVKLNQMILKTTLIQLIKKY